jgi:Carboxypeptidase regulatory-like domain
MKRALLALCASACCGGVLQAAVVRGIVLDNYTGRPLARAVVTLKSIEGYTPVNVAARADRTGVFTFPPVDAGGYLLTAGRPGFATLRYGQKAWNAPGTPVFLEQEGTTFLQLRLRRLGAITGTVWDENEIGFPEQDVAIYRVAHPPRLITKIKTDDRGVYRFGLLSPGRYLIRSLAKQLDEETGLLPTFHKEAAAVEDAGTIEVGMDEQVADINVRPLFGKLCQLSGVISPPPQIVTLASDMGDIGGSADGSGQFTFQNLAPGTYELLASTSMGRYQYGAYQKIQLERDLEIRVNLQAVPTMQIGIEERDGKRIDPRAFVVFTRRTTLAGTGPSLRIRDGMPILPGRWEIAVQPAADFYPVSIAVEGRDLRPGGRADGWHEFLALPGRYNVLTRIVVSAKPAGIRGKVTGPGGDRMIGAPVYLEAIHAETHKRLLDPLSTRTDARGEYRFHGLPPGTYRLLSTFDIEDPDEAMMEAARARQVQVKEAATEPLDLDLYIK